MFVKIERLLQIFSRRIPFFGQFRTKIMKFTTDPSITAPLWSSTVPRISPVDLFCAVKRPALKTRATKANRTMWLAVSTTCARESRCGRFRSSFRSLPEISSFIFILLRMRSQFRNKSLSGYSLRVSSQTRLSRWCYTDLFSELR